MNERIIGFYPNYSPADEGGGRTAAALSTSSVSQSGRTAAAREVPGMYQPSPLAEVVPGVGPPTVEEMPQWKPGNVTRYSYCGRVRPSGLIYCLFCGCKQMIRWAEEREPTILPLPAMPLQDESP